MTDALKMSRKALTIGVVLTTALWSMMASVLVAPMKASAAGCTSGTLIKGSLPAVYYCGADMKRYVFTNDKAYKTWYSDFSGVMTISDADLASIQIGGNATYRPGVKMVKIQSDPKVYAIAHGGVLRPIASEAVATALYGATWNKQIDDIADAFFTNYSVGSAITAASDFDKNAEMSGSQSINQDKGLSTITVSGSLSASIASDNPASATVPLGATGVNMLKFNLHNGGASSAAIDTVTVHRSGPGSTSDFANVYLYEGSTRLTTGRSVNSSTNDATFTGLNLMLAAGQTRTLWVAADISSSANAADVNMLSVAHAMSGTADAAGIPVMGNNFTISGATVGQLTVAKTGSVSNPKLGEMGAKVAEFTVGAGSSEDVMLKRLTIYQAGNLAAGNITNLTLKQAGLTLATSTGFDSQLHATFDMPAGFLLQKGQTKTFQVYADIGGTARAADTLRLYVEQDADVYGVGQTFGYGASVVRTAYDGDSCGDNAGDCSGSHVDAGQVTIGFSGPSSANIATNGKDVELFHFTMVAQSNIEVRKLDLQFSDSSSGSGNAGLVCEASAGTCGSTATANYTDVKVTNVTTGTTWWGPKDVSTTGSDSSQELAYTDVWTLQAGQTYEFKVTSDIAQTANPNDQITVRLNAFNDQDLRNLDNNTNLDHTTDVVPSGNVTGNPMTIQAPGLTATLSTTPVSQSYVKGTQGIDFVGVNLKSGDSTPITVTEVDTTGNVSGTDGNGFNSDVLTCRLMDGSTQLGQSKSPTSAGVMNFTNVNVDVAAGATKTLKVNCDTSNSAVATHQDAVEINGITAQDPDGNSVTAKDASATAISTTNRVNDGDTTKVTITSTGSMTYALAPDDTESEAGLVIAGQSGVVLGKIRLTAANEELKQTKLRVGLVNANAASSVVDMSLYDGSTLVAGPVTVSGTNTDFSGMNFVVPKDGSKTLTVKATLNTISAGATSGRDLQIVVDTTSVDGQANFEYRGTSSSTVVTAQPSGTDITGRSKIIRKTKPTVSLASLPTSTLSNGTQVVARFTVTADSAQQVSLKTISFEMNLNNVGSAALALTSPAIREVGQGSDLSATTTSAVLNCTAATSVTCDFPISFTNEQSIAAGTSKTYELRMTVAGADTSGESISSKLTGDTVVATGALADSGRQVTSTAYNFIWSDNSAIPHNDTDAGSADWTNGTFVKVLPSDTQTMSRS